MAADKNSAALVQMNTNHPHPDDAKLGELLRQSRVAPPLPPRFQDNVWRRIADDEAGQASAPGWLEAALAFVLRPRFALAAVAALVVAGALIGVQDGSQLARHDAQARYLAAVAPNSLH